MGLGSKRLKRFNNSDPGSEEESELVSEMEEDGLEEDEQEEEEEEDGDKEEETEEEEDEEEDSTALQNEAQKETEMEELEKEYSSLRHQEQDLLRSLTRHKDEDLLKGQAVKNQKALWDKMLELRFLLQKPFSSSNKLPKGPIRLAFCNSDKSVDQAYSDLISSSEKTLDCLVELQEALVERNPSRAQLTNGTNRESGKSEDAPQDLDADSDGWSCIHRMHSRIAPFRNSSIDKWQRKTQVTTGAAAFKGKLNAFNQNISEQVASYMRDPSRMIKRMQLRRSSAGVLGEVPEESSTVKEEGADVEGDPELVDDSEFYQQLLKEFLESCDPASSETTFYALKRLQTKKRKIVDRRASKSRKIRYHVHEKIVNFMAPEPMVLPPMAPKLFENLFGLRNQKSSSIA